MFDVHIYNTCTYQELGERSDGASRGHKNMTPTADR